MAASTPETASYTSSGLSGFMPEKELLLRETTVPIAPKAFHILLVLIRHNKQVVTKDDLMKTIWPDTFVRKPI